MNRWTCSPPLSIHTSFGKKPCDFLLLWHGLSHWLKFSHEEEKSGINTFMCVREGGSQRDLFKFSVCPWFEWGNVAWWLLHLEKVIYWRWLTVIPCDSLHHSLHSSPPFSILFLEVKPAFLASERPAAHDWMPDICRFPLCGGRWNPREYLPSCWHFVWLIGLYFFHKTGNARACPFLSNSW